MAKRTRAAGRPGGAKNKKNAYPRDQTGDKFRASEGFVCVVEILVKSGRYKSKADVYHEAVSILAMRNKIDDKAYNFWVDKIL